MPSRKPKLGQNFLIDDAARQQIADALGDIAHRTVIEIGPGRGAITNILARRARNLLCIEIDRALADELRFRFRNHTHVEILTADILQTDLTSLVPSDEKALVVGNLPYYITSDILLHLFRHSAALELAIVMMQREVADRVAATPGTRDFGLLSATAQMHAQVTALFTLPPAAFAPPPEVYSTVLRMRFANRFLELGISDPDIFDRFLKQCFRQKRKTILNNLRAAGYAHGERAMRAVNITPATRAEDLELTRLAELFNALTQQVSAPGE